MKTIIIAFLLVCYSNFAQQKYVARTGIVSFEASVPSFEEVAAVNNSVTAIIDISNGEFASLALINGFRFKNALMEEHFNENYAESKQFPKSTFKGKIKDFKMDTLTSSKNTYQMEGELTFHGVTKFIADCQTTIFITDNRIIMEGNFTVFASDFDIKIPNVVRNKVSEEISIRFNFELLN